VEIADEHVQTIMNRENIKYAQAKEIALNESTELKQISVRFKIIIHTLNITMEPIAKIFATHRWREISGWEEYVQEMPTTIYSGLLINMNEWLDNIYKKSKQNKSFLGIFLQAESFQEQREIAK